MAIYIIHVETLSLQPMEQYIITTMFDPSPYVRMVRWHDYRILLLTLLTMYYSIFCLVMFGGSAWRLM